MRGYAAAVEGVEQLKGRGLASARPGVRAEHREGFELSSLHATVAAARPPIAPGSTSDVTDCMAVIELEDKEDGGASNDDSEWEMMDHDDDREPEERAVDIALQLAEMSLAGG